LFSEVWGTPLAPTYNNNWCGGTGSMLAIDPDGNLYPCIRYMESSLGNDQPPIIIGTVKDGLMKKDCEKKCISCMKGITRRSQSTDQCFYCPIASGCAWCSGYNYQIYGDVNKRATFICEMHKARCLANVYFHNSYHKKMNDGQVKDLWVPRQWAVPIIGEEEYNNLVSLTKELGGYVNEDITMIDIGSKHINEIPQDNYKDFIILNKNYK
jgi:radical SAM protein with 4Fe4S-binding SPASM domain